MNTENRRTLLDQIKGGAILGVIFIHAGFLGGITIAGEFIGALSRLAVPIFIVFFSYFLASSVHRKSQVIAYKQRLISLVYPFIFWSLIYFFITVDYDLIKNAPIKILTKYFSGYGWAGQYFFIICFQLVIVFPILLKKGIVEILEKPVFLISAIMYVLLTYLPEFVPNIIQKISDRPFFYWLPYAILGIKMANSNSIILSDKLWVYLIVLLVPLESLLVPNDQEAFSPYTRLSILLVVYLLIPRVLSIKKLIPGIFGKILAAFGQKSMALFVMNPLAVIMLDSISWLPILPINPTVNFGLSILIVILIAAALFGVSSLIKRSPLHQVV